MEGDQHGDHLVSKQTLLVIATLELSFSVDVVLVISELLTEQVPQGRSNHLLNNLVTVLGADSHGSTLETKENSDLTKYFEVNLQGGDLLWQDSLEDVPQLVKSIFEMLGGQKRVEKDTAGLFISGQL
jgi:hypothetical protein